MRATTNSVSKNFTTDEVMKSHHAIEKPDDLRARLASAKGHDVATNGVVKDRALILVDLSNNSAEVDSV